jgi:serine/threonine protein kinase
VLYECLTGEPPFRRETDVATLYAHLEDGPSSPSAKDPGVPAAFDAVVARATAKRQDERFATAAELGAAIRAAAQPQFGRSPRPGPERRRRYAAIAAASHYAGRLDRADKEIAEALDARHAAARVRHAGTNVSSRDDTHPS